MCEGVESTKHRENDELRLLAFGATRPQAVAALLLLHVLLTGATMLLTGFLLLLLWWPLRVHHPDALPVLHAAARRKVQRTEPICCLDAEVDGRDLIA
jgi:hypothetical protein